VARRTLGHSLHGPARGTRIATDQVQRSGGHAGAHPLRFPRVKRVRWDKRPEDADRLDRVAEVYQSHHNMARGDEPERTPEPTLFDGL
jgi:hypothetical protein